MGEGGNEGMKKVRNKGTQERRNDANKKGGKEQTSKVYWLPFPSISTSGAIIPKRSFKI